MSAEEYQAHMERRRHEESVRSLFQTGFWKYPASIETLPKEEGGQGLNFHPFVKDEKFLHRAVSGDAEADRQPVANGPDLSVKTGRKPWLKDGKIMPYLIKSPSRCPLQVCSLISYLRVSWMLLGLLTALCCLQRPRCKSYFTSPVVTSSDAPVSRSVSRLSLGYSSRSVD